MVRVLCVAVLLAVQVQGASAQMVTSNNPPPQRLFDTAPSHQMNNGLGTMADRRAQLAQVKRRTGPVRR